MTIYKMIRNDGLINEISEIDGYEGQLYNFVNRFKHGEKTRCFTSVLRKHQVQEYVNHWIEKGYEVYRNGIAI